MPEYPELIYRGNYEVSVGVDYGGSFLRAEYGGGYSETEVIFPALLTCRLTYSALSRRALITPGDAEPTDRLTYVYGFYRAQMDRGRRPFLMRWPLDDKMYLWEFV